MQKEMIENNPILKLSFDFSLLAIDYCELLDVNKKFVVSRQLLKAATSIGANSFEAQNAESKADFIHKMKIAAKESSETLYWLMLCERSDGYQFDKKLRSDLDEIVRILSKIISSSKGKIPVFILSIMCVFSNFQILKLTH